MLGIGTACKEPDVAAPDPLPPIPTKQQLAWHRMETNVFVHFTVNTFTGREWGFGNESPKIFNPTDFDPEQWMKTFKKVGFKGIILTAKHHDGFCLWPSKYTDHDIANSPFKNGNGDVVQAVSKAARKYGLKFGIYLSPWDRNRADYGKPGYINYYRNQLRELFTNYGPIYEMWFDGANGGNGYYGGANEERRIDRKHYYHWPKTLQIIKDLQPKTLLFSDSGPDLRWVGNENGIAGKTNWNMLTPDTLYPGKAHTSHLLRTGAIDGSDWIPAEVDVSIRPGWFYHPNEDSLVKSPEKLFDIYLKSVGRGSTLLLNVPPDKRGLIHREDIKALEAWRKKIDETFSDNLAANASVQASSFRGGDESFAGSKVTDGNPDTYWTTDDSVKHGSLEIDLGSDQTIKYIMLQEYITLGQRVKSFDVQIPQDGEWKTITGGTTIGYKRILPLNQPVNTSKIRVQIKDSRACPLISNIALF